MSTNWNELIQRYIAGDLADDEARLLQEALKQDAALADLYLDYINLDVALEAHAGAVEMARETLAVQRQKRRAWLSWRPIAAAASLAAVVALAWLLWPHPGERIEIVNVSANVSPAYVKGSTVRTEGMRINQGSVRVRLASGVLLDLAAPVEMKVLDSMHVRVLSGRVTADVGEHGKGFVVDTPQTRIVDLGTRFGVDASEAGHTDVVVFQGRVELYQDGKNERVALLSTGEALRVQDHRRTSRIVNVGGTDGAVGWSTSDHAAKDSVISAVRDNLSGKAPSLQNFYRIVPGGLCDGSLAFADQNDKWNEVPSSLVGADLVRTFAVDGFNWWLKITLTVQRPAELFVFVDKRRPVPEWLSASFADTGQTIILDFVPKQSPQNIKKLEYAVWRRVLQDSGDVTLGAPYPDPPADKKSFHPNRMFGVAARALP